MSAKPLQLYPTLWDPMDCSPPGSSVPGILQSRILEDWRQEEKGTTEGELVGWHHWLDGHELEQAPGVSDRQGNLVCFSPQGHKESDLTEQLNWLKWLKLKFEKNLNSIYNKIKKQHALSWTSIFPICSRVLFFFLFLLLLLYCCYCWSTFLF